MCSKYIITIFYDYSVLINLTVIKSLYLKLFMFFFFSVRQKDLTTILSDWQPGRVLGFLIIKLKTGYFIVNRAKQYKEL